MVALVWAWLVAHPEHFCAWVAPHKAIRYSGRNNRWHTTTVGGHWRRLASWGRVLPSLAAVCKFERLVRPKLLGVPPSVARLARDESGLLPRSYRVLVWV